MPFTSTFPTTTTPYRAGRSLFSPALSRWRVSFVGPELASSTADALFDAGYGLEHSAPFGGFGEVHLGEVSGSAAGPDDALTQVRSLLDRNGRRYSHYRVTSADPFAATA